jgi:multidrug efflux pump subunit AcrA (membrane-fusion protein)
MEIEIANEQRALKPGMFVRAQVILGKTDRATIVPFTAIATRDGQTGVFVVDESGRKVAWRPVELGIRDGERVEVKGEGIERQVVTLGHQLVDDGSAIEIPQVEPRKRDEPR